MSTFLINGPTPTEAITAVFVIVISGLAILAVLHKKNGPKK